MNHFLSVVAALFLVGLSHSFVVNQFSSNYYKNIFIKNGYTKQSDGTWNSYKQSLDHWNNSNSEQFDQWFYSIPGFYRKYGPIFILLGGQTSISEDIFDYTLALDLAIEHRAYFVYLEHRFYDNNQHRGTSDTEIPEQFLEYLTVDQAIMDIHKFIEFARGELVQDLEAPIILMGWQYAGSLAVWYQHKHPGIVSGVWASSSPMQAKIDFSSYLEAIGKEIRIVGSNDCYERLDLGIRSAETLYRNGQVEQLESEFHICNATSPDNNIVVLTASLAYDFGVALQQKSHKHIESFCSALEKYPIEHALQSLLKEMHSDECIPIDRKRIEQLFQTKEYRLWSYQQCSGLGWIPNSSSKLQPFGTLFPVTLFYEVCKILFGSRFSPEYINELEQQFNENYGGLKPQVENVIFVNGELDPNKDLHVTSRLSNRTYVINIPESRHLSDITSHYLSENNYVKAAKETIQQRIAQFLRYY